MQVQLQYRGELVHPERRERHCKTRSTSQLNRRVGHPSSIDDSRKSSSCDGYTDSHGEDDELCSVRLRFDAEYLRSSVLRRDFGVCVREVDEMVGGVRRSPEGSSRDERSRLVPGSFAS